MNPIKQEIDDGLEELFASTARFSEDADYSVRSIFDCKFKTIYRLLRKTISSYIRTKMKKNFKQILYVTLFEPPTDYILSFRKQYPDKEFIVLIPIVGETKGLVKTPISFDYFLQNHNHTAQVYKFPKNKENIRVYGIYSEEFSNVSSRALFNDIKCLSAYMKCVRLFAKKFACDIVHSERIPFYLGAEFETKLKHPKKVFQTVEELNRKSDMYEPFWAFINVADKAGMKKLCRDKIIQKCVASLFKRNAADKSYNIRECLNFVYDNYLNFRITIDKSEEVAENAIFERLNARVLKLFPNIFPKESTMYSPMYYTLKKADFWAVFSKTYYKDIYKNTELVKGYEDILKQSESNSSYVQYGCNIEPSKLHDQFDLENFRKNRKENKKYLLKEFGKSRIETRFIDNSLFIDECKIGGYLDSFYEAPLLFVSLSSNVNEDGVDIAISSILKLFELNRNIQVIFNIPNGLRNKYIASFVEFCENTKALGGRLLFLDGKINLPQFFAASDLILLPERKNVCDCKHYEAMKYGCVPVYGRNGIYNDLIPDIFEDMAYGCGFKSDTGLNISENPDETFLRVLTKALNFYVDNGTSYNILIRNCMEYDSSWNFNILEQYNKIYEELI